MNKLLIRNNSLIFALNNLLYGYTRLLVVPGRVWQQANMITLYNQMKI